MYFDFSPFIFGEHLRLDGSNFGEWYPSLLAALEKNFVLYVIQGPLRDQPDDSEGEDAYDDWREERDVYIRVEWLMRSNMAYDLGVQFRDTQADEIIQGLKTRFAGPENRFLSFTAKNVKNHRRGILT